MVENDGRESLETASWVLGWFLKRALRHSPLEKMWWRKVTGLGRLVLSICGMLVAEGECRVAGMDDMAHI